MNIRGWRIHHQQKGQTLIPCRPQCRQRHICAYHPAPNSSKPSCGVSSPQSRQKLRKRSDPSSRMISWRRARCDIAKRSPSAANIRCKRFSRTPPVGPPGCSAGRKLNRSTMLRGGEGQGVTGDHRVLPRGCPKSLHQPCQPNLCLRLRSQIRSMAPDRATALSVGMIGLIRPFRRLIAAANRTAGRQQSLRGVGLKVRIHLAPGRSLRTIGSEAAKRPLSSFQTAPPRLAPYQN